MSLLRVFCFVSLVFAVASTVVNAAVGDEKWSFQTLGSVFGSAAVGEDGSIYFGSRDNKVYCVSAEGSLRWEFETGDWVDSSPTLNADESRIYVGSWDNHLYALSALDGSQLWRFETGSLVASSPALDIDGNIFFGSSDGFFYSLDPTGELRWSYYVGAELDCSPAVGEDGSVYVGGYEGILYSFSNDGESIWEFSARESSENDGSRIAGPIAIGEEGVVYFGSADGFCYAVEASGEKVWEFEAFEKVDTGVVLGNDGEVIFASRSGYVYAVDDFGVLLWESFVGDVFFSTPMIDASGSIYVGSYTGNGISSMNVLDSNGAIMWEYPVFDYIDSPPVLASDGSVLFGCYDGALYAVEAQATPSLSSWARYGGGEANRSLRVAYEPLVLSERFGEWVSSLQLEGVFADPCFDADKDGLPLALEYLLGGEASVSDGGELSLGVEFADEVRRVYFDYTVVVGDEEISYTVEYSENGNEWAALNSLSGAQTVLLDADSKGDGWYETWRTYLPTELPFGVLIRVRMGCGSSSSNL